MPSELMTTAEWICTRCGVTNRKLVPQSVTASDDACVSCHTAHDIEADDRPTRWRSRPRGN